MTVVMKGGAKRVTVIRKASGSAPSHRIVERDAMTSRVAAVDGVKFVVIDASGHTRHGAIVEDLGEIKKQNKTLRPVEKRLRKVLRRQLQTLDFYLTLHDRSNRKKKNGWLRDLGSNMAKARRKPGWE
jgi:hypothetical protein